MPCKCIIASGPNKGKQCSNKARAGSSYCGVHKNCKNDITRDHPAAAAPAPPEAAAAAAAGPDLSYLPLELQLKIVDFMSNDEIVIFSQSSEDAKALALTKLRDRYKLKYKLQPNKSWSVYDLRQQLLGQYTIVATMALDDEEGDRVTTFHVYADPRPLAIALGIMSDLLDESDNPTEFNVTPQIDMSRGSFVKWFRQQHLKFANEHWTWEVSEMRPEGFWVARARSAAVAGPPTTEQKEIGQLIIDITNKLRVE